MTIQGRLARKTWFRVRRHSNKCHGRHKDRDTKECFAASVEAASRENAGGAGGENTGGAGGGGGGTRLINHYCSRTCSMYPAFLFHSTIHCEGLTTSTIVHVPWYVNYR